MKRSALLLSVIVTAFVLTLDVHAAPNSVISKATWAALLDARKSARWQNVSYHISDDFIISARNSKTRKLLWTTPYIPIKSLNSHAVTVEPIELLLNYYHGTLYASDNFSMTAIRADNGHQIWRTIYPNVSDGWLMIQEGVIVVPYTSSGAKSTEGVQALDARTGRFIWRRLGVYNASYDKRRRGYLIFYCYDLIGTAKASQKAFVNIKTGQ